jgi:hypothetical protein
MHSLLVINKFSHQQHPNHAMIIASRKGTPHEALNFITNSTRKQPIISISYQHKPNPQHQI